MSIESISSTKSGLPSAAVDDARFDRLPPAPASPTRLSDKARALVVGEWLEEDRGRIQLPAAPRRPELEQLGPRHAEEQHEAPLGTSRQGAR